MAIFNCWH